jgi:2-methylcitrate dehydratase PrpD
MAKRCLLDLIGVGAAGRTTKLAGIICDHAVDEFGTSGPRMLFDGRRTSASGAAMAGGMTIDAFDAHDGHPMTKGHAGCGLLPALLAMADCDDIDMSGTEFLRLLALGYEISIRDGIALHASTPDYHTSGAWVSVGSAAICAAAMGLSRTQMDHAMGIAEYHGPRSQMMRVIDYPTMLKDGSGWGAMAGVSAARMAARGFTGAPAITLNEEAFGDLGSRWRIEEQYFKPYPVCRWAQPPVQALLDLRSAHDFAAEDVDFIRVFTFHEAVRLHTHTPKDTEEAQYSLPFPVAAMLVRGKIGPDEISPEGLSDPEVLRISQGMILAEEDRFNAVFPAQRWARIEVVLKSGEVLKSADTVAHGSMENPLSDLEISDKFQGLMTAAGVGNGAGIEAQVAALDGGDLGALIDAITSPLSRDA